MFEKLYARKKAQQAELDLLESFLDAALTPVGPRSGFVNDLRRQLLISDWQEQISKPATNLPRSLLVVGGILGSLIVVLSGVRGLVSLIGVGTLLFQQSRRSPNPKTATMV